MLPSEIGDGEGLFRGVPRDPKMWKALDDRPSSAAFKDSNGASVDRDGGRTAEAICASLKSRADFFAIVEITAGECRAFDAHPVPTPPAPFHAEIHDSSTRVELRDSKARKIAKACRLVRKYC
jgi:hypothetical protein